MRILVTSDARHRYPARNYPVSQGGLAGFRVLDNIVKGLAELGHDVFYLLPGGADVPIPRGATMVTSAITDVDILHAQDRELTYDGRDYTLPWVRTCHTDVVHRGWERSRVPASEHWIFVSRTLATTYGWKRFVVNGIDPEEFIYAETKEDYILFMCHLDRALMKGLDTALALSRKAGFRLLIAGSATTPEAMEASRKLCEGHDAVLLGEVQGVRRAEVLAGARALLFPTRANEAGTVILESLMSGTPVICSDSGACAELVSPDVGFVCKTDEDYLHAVETLPDISTRGCREKALRDYHYLRMARDYVKEYELELSRPVKEQAISRQISI